MLAQSSRAATISARLAEPRTRAAAALLSSPGPPNPAFARVCSYSESAYHDSAPAVSNLPSTGDAARSRASSRFSAISK